MNGFTDTLTELDWTTLYDFTRDSSRIVFVYIDPTRKDDLEDVASDHEYRIHGTFSDDDELLVRLAYEDVEAEDISITMPF